MKPAHSEDYAHPWQALRLLNLYRLSIAGLFALLVFLNKLPLPLGSHNRELFIVASFIYVAFSIVANLAMRWRRPWFEIQIYTNTIADIAAITLLMHASGGINSGLGMLLVVAIAGSGILLARRLAGLSAAVATFAVFGEQFYGYLVEGAPIRLPQSGMLGASFFATASLAYFLARRIRESEALAAQRGVDLSNMAQLTEAIIQRMQTGIVVVDDDHHIRLRNESAGQLLKVPPAHPAEMLQELSADLAQQFQDWRARSDSQSHAFRASPTGPNVIPRFAHLGTGDRSATLIFLEDTAAMQQQAQQLKLASLGRLAASIAHEIRNPLGAISHAGQLLEESPALDEDDKRLTQIIRNQSQRMNAIIENVLQLSRRDASQPVLFDLRPWLENFVQEFVQPHPIDANAIAIDIDPPDLEVRMTEGHLHQILTNLSENGLRHTVVASDRPALELRGGIGLETQRPFLDMIDHGPGIAPEVAEHLFEPFFTTEQQGTGLGLYIARELAESNRTQLDYIPAPGGGSCFRLSFPNPKRLNV